MPTDAADPIVTTTRGAVRGRWREDPRTGASAAFLGVPFAQAPVGPLRFAAPEPMEPWDDVRDAVEYGATPQRWVAPVTLIPEPSVPGPATLNVNVFTPAPGEPGAALPVLVWIHGGGYVSGSPASPWYDGRAFTRDGVVTVSISYRLGFDGFGWIEGAPANRAVLDWIAALEWVRAEIAAFGGDPGRVTIAGQSAGGGAVLRLLALPAAQHLFHAAIALSPAIADIPPARAREVAKKLGEILEVPPTRDGFASTHEKAIEKHQMPATHRGARGLAAVRAALMDAVAYGPVVDGELISQPTVAALAQGVGADKPLLIGSTDDEFSLATDQYRRVLRFVPGWLGLAALGVPREIRGRYRRANRSLRGSAAVLGRYVSDTVFRSLVRRVAVARTDAARTAATRSDAAPTWVYRFSWRSTSRGSALHCLDVPFFFDCLASDRVDDLAGANPPQSLADVVHGSAAAFVRGGDPGWRAWSERPGSTRVYGAAAGRTDVIADGYSEVAALS